MSDNKRRIYFALLDAFKQLRQVVLHGSLAMRNVRPRLIADPIGILSSRPP